MPDAPELGRPALAVIDAGLMDYKRCIALQHRLHAQVAGGDAAGFVLIVQHPPVLTFGKHAERANLLFAAEHFASQGVALVDTDRGGEVTAHEPGQLVLYPILRLADFGLSPRRYVGLLEAAVIRTLSGFGLAAGVDPVAPGVWLGAAKICAIGVRIKQRATLHGIALNVCNSLALFGQIVPCGLRGRAVTSLSRQLGREVPVADVAPPLLRALLSALGAVEAPADTRMASRLQWEDLDFTI